MATREMPIKVRFKAFDALSGTLDKLKAKFPELARGVSRANTSFHLLDKSTEKFSRTANKIGGALQKTGAALSAAVTLPVVAAGTFSVKAFADFETALLGIGKTTNTDAGPALDALGEKFLDMSKRIPISVVELLELGKAAAQLGVGVEDVAHFSEVMGKLARATSGTVAGEEGAAELARFIGVTRGSIKDVERYASAIVKLGNTSKATEGEILSFALRLGGSTAIFGVNGQQALALATTLKQVGIEAEAGSSSVQRAMADMGTAISKGGVKLDVLSKLTGVSKAALPQMFKENAVGVLRNFAVGLDRVAKSGGNVKLALEYFGMDGVRDLTTLGALSQNVAEFDKKLKDVNEAYADNQALTKEFNAAMQSLDAQFQISKNSFFAAGVTLGRSLKPALMGVMEALKPVILWFAEHPTITLWVFAIGAAAAAVATLMLGVGTLLTMTGSFVLTLALWQAGMVGFGAVSWAALAPILLLAAKIILIIAALGLMAYAVWQVAKAFQDGWVPGLEKVLSLLSKVSLGAAVANWAYNKWKGDAGGGTPFYPTPTGAPVGATGAPTGALEAAGRSNLEFLERTNNAHVRVEVRAPRSTKVEAESEGGIMSYFRGMAGETL